MYLVIEASFLRLLTFKNLSFQIYRKVHYCVMPNFESCGLMRNSITNQIIVTTLVKILAVIKNFKGCVCYFSTAYLFEPPL